jgi:hypothetical protein
LLADLGAFFGKSIVIDKFIPFRFMQEMLAMLLQEYAGSGIIYFHVIDFKLVL